MEELAVICQARLSGTIQFTIFNINNILQYSQYAIYVHLQRISKIFNRFHFSEGSVIGPDELPPPYEKTGGVPMVSCRVCQVPIANCGIDAISLKTYHVVDCRMM